MTLQQQFESYEQAMCRSGSGLTQEQMIGAAVALAWIEEKGTSHFAQRVRAELARAREKHPGGMHTPHEGYAVIFEELCEFFDECRRQKHDPIAMLDELVQVAAMAQRTAEDCIGC